MTMISNTPKAIALAAMLAIPAAGSLSAQEAQPVENDGSVTVYGSKGPQIEGIISARHDDTIEVTSANGTVTVIALDAETEIKGRGGFLGLNRKTRGEEALLNGLPVTVETLQSGSRLLADEIRFKNDDLETAAMIRNATAQRFAAQRADIDENTAAAEALRNRVADIDKYNIKGTTNVYFDTGKWNLKAGAESELCQAASEAEAMDNAILLVVGYTDSVGSQEYNQVLSERRAARVVNFLQQECGWKPWRMLTPTGFAEADPLADNDTEEGKAQNRRVAVNILVSKSVEGL